MNKDLTDHDYEATQTIPSPVSVKIRNNYGRWHKDLVKRAKAKGLLRYFMDPYTIQQIKKARVLLTTLPIDSNPLLPDSKLYALARVGSLDLESLRAELEGKDKVIQVKQDPPAVFLGEHERQTLERALEKDEMAGSLLFGGISDVDEAHIISLTAFEGMHWLLEKYKKPDAHALPKFFGDLTAITCTSSRISAVKHYFHRLQNQFDKILSCDPDCFLKNSASQLDYTEQGVDSELCPALFSLIQDLSVKVRSEKGSFEDLKSETLRIAEFYPEKLRDMLPREQGLSVKTKTVPKKEKQPKAVSKSGKDNKSWRTGTEGNKNRSRDPCSACNSTVHQLDDCESSGADALRIEQYKKRIAWQNREQVYTGIDCFAR